MATIPQVIECGESGGGTLTINPDGTRSRAVALRWLVGKLSGYDAAEAFGRKLAPDVYRGHRRARLEPQVVGGGWFLITAEYANSSILIDSSPGCVGAFGSWQFSFEAQSEHITQAWTDSRASESETANPNAYVTAWIAGRSLPCVLGTTNDGVAVPDYRGAIGVEVDQIRGADRPKSVLGWTETWHFPAKSLTQKRPPLKRLSSPDGSGNRTVEEIDQPPLMEVWEKTAAHQNVRKFRGFDAGEVLFNQPRSPEIHAGATMASVTFSFTVQRTRKNQWVGDILVPVQGGWDMLDIHYETSSEASGVVRKPKIVYVVRTIPSADFDALGLGTDLPQYWLDDAALAHQWDDFVGRV